MQDNIEHVKVEQPRRSLGPAVVSAVVGALIGGVLIFTVSQVAQDSDIPEDRSVVSANDALLGSVEYGAR